MADLEEMDERTQEALLHVAVVINTNAQEIRKRMSEAMQVERKWRMNDGRVN